MEESPAEILQRVPSYLEQERYKEAERLLIAVLREAEEGSLEHTQGLIGLGELYEREERYQEGLIVCRDLQQLSSDTDLGGRAHDLLGRLREATGP